MIAALICLPLAALVGGWLTRPGEGPAAGFVDRHYRALVVAAWSLVVLATAVRWLVGGLGASILSLASFCFLAALFMPAARRLGQRQG